MLCDVCHSMFKQKQPPTKSLWDPRPQHHSSPRDVWRASLEGCRICRKLWKHGMLFLPERAQKLEASKYAETTFTEYHFEPVRDEVDTRWSKWETDPPREKLRSTESWYKLSIGWHGQEYTVGDICFYLRDSSGSSHTLLVMSQGLASLTEKPGFASSENDYTPSKEVDDPATWALLRRWVKNSQPSDPEFHPSRLLDLEPENLDLNSIRLVETGECKPTTPYMTISHCWGESAVVKLSSSNLAGFLDQGLLLSRLPRLYKDCIRVAKQLGQRYLWIDSLCIIQDSNEDWLREASRMALVYRNSWCNIAATDAKDSDGTLFFTRDDPAAIRPLEVTLWWHPKGPTQFFLYETSPEEPLASRPLNQRGWVLQEKLLAPRTINFGKDLIRWESLEGDASETFPGGEPSTLHGRDLLQHSVPLRPNHLLKNWIAKDGQMYFNFGRSDRHKSPWDGFWLSWKQIVEEYTRRFLTFGTDKVVAIAGIASVLSKGEGNGVQGGSRYLAGMWNRRFTIEYELLWTAGPQPDGQPARRSQVYRAPSWSWMSVDGIINYRYKRDYDMTGDTQMAYVEDAKVITVDGSLTGPIASAHIIIEGPLVEDYRLYSSYDDLEDVSLQASGPASAWLIMFSHYSDQLLWGLALRRIESGSNQGCYQRVGTFQRCCDENHELYQRLYKTPKQKITIV